MPLDFPANPTNGQIYEGFVYDSTLNSWESSSTVASLSARISAIESRVPAGTLHQWTTATAPQGYLLCQGQEISRTQFPNLFSAVGTIYGLGNGSTTFNLPDLRSRIPVGVQSPTTLGTATITIASPAVVTEASHGLATGSIVYFTTTGALPTGVTANTRYWAIVNDSNTFRLATSLSNAFAGTAINTSGTQSGTHTVYKSNYDLGRVSGAETHTLTPLEMPVHTHIQDSHNHTQDSHNHTQNSHSHSIPGGYVSPSGTQSGFTYTPLAGGSDYGFTYSNTEGTQATTATNIATTAVNDPTTATNQNTGGGGAHSNLQPYIVLNYIIKT